MKLHKVSFKLAEEILEVLIQLLEAKKKVDQSMLFKATGKSEPYLKPALNFLKSMMVIEEVGESIGLCAKWQTHSKIVPSSILKAAVINFEPFKEFLDIIQNGKSEKLATKRVKAIYDIVNNVEQIQEIFAIYLEYTNDGSLSKKSKSHVKKELSSVKFSDSKDEMLNIKGEHIVNQKEFINKQRIECLKYNSNIKFDTARLVKICEEINDAYNMENYITVGVLLRVILDHVPPIFEKKSFAEVANNYGPKSFKDVMINLENFQRKIADGFLHSQIRKKETLPTEHTIDCRNAVDILLAETINGLICSSSKISPQNT